MSRRVKLSEAERKRRRAEAARKYRLTHPDRIRETNKRHYERKGRDGGRAYNLRIKYGLTVEAFSELLRAQDSRCAICFRSIEVGKFLHVDHDHATGKVRGLLCNFCNTALGMLGDCAETMRRAISYLERARG